MKRFFSTQMQSTVFKLITVNIYLTEKKEDLFHGNETFSFALKVFGIVMGICVDEKRAESSKRFLSRNVANLHLFLQIFFGWNCSVIDRWKSIWIDKWTIPVMAPFFISIIRWRMNNMNISIFYFAVFHCIIFFFAASYSDGLCILCCRVSRHGTSYFTKFLLLFQRSHIRSFFSLIKAKVC